MFPGMAGNFNSLKPCTMNMLSAEQKNCLVCGHPLRGRVDKKFCDDQCRNRYNNGSRIRERQNPLVRQVNNALLQNRRVLETVLAGKTESVRISREKMMEYGFRFRYITGMSRHRNGQPLFYCYEFGIRPLENDLFLVTRKKEE